MKRIQETYNMFMILSFILNAVIIGVVFVLPLYIIINLIICE